MGKRVNPDLIGKRVHIGILADQPYQNQWGELTGDVFTTEEGDKWYEVFLPEFNRHQTFTAQMLSSRDGVHHVLCSWCKRKPGFKLTTVENSHGICPPCSTKHFPGKEAA